MSLAGTAGAGQSQSDIAKDIESLVMDYSRFEDTIDMESQFDLIAEDRWWHGPIGRRTDNAMWKMVQQEQFSNFKKAFPNVKVYREVRDLMIRVIGKNVAIASFTWFPNRIVPSDLPQEKREALGPNPVPVVVSLVWEKRGDSWKIVNTHISLMNIGS
jgi:hypothetical protein